MNNKIFIGKKYAYELPRKDLHPKIVWLFKDDTYSRQILSPMISCLNKIELESILSICKREIKGLDKIKQITGRTASLRSVSIMKMDDVPFDNIEINGFGYQRFNKLEKGFASLNLVKPIGLPRSKNFAATYPHFRNRVVSGKTTLQLPMDYSFFGAYTENQLLRKAAANLVLLKESLKNKKPDFLIPIPLAVGIYPGILDPEKKPAYFIVYRVPYSSRRSGIISNVDFTSIVKDIDALIRYAPKMGQIIRIFHDKFSLTHNQLVGANYFVSKGKKHVPFIADFSSIYPLSKKANIYARSHDLSLLISNIILATTKLCPWMKTENYVERLFNKTLSFYLGYPVYIKLKENNILKSLNQALYALLQKNLPSHTDNYWKDILMVEKQLKSVIYTNK